MNISQYLALFVRDGLNCETIFTLTGGGAMFLNDAFGNTQGLKCIYNHHEQAAAMAAVGYSKIKGIGVCITTTGCGATNAITGLLDAWQDSQPVLFISGQVKIKETTYFSGLSLRSFGIQELDILPIVRSITKASFCVGSKSEFFEIIQQVPDFLFAGRPGPVWLDIPLDIQSQEITINERNLYISDVTSRVSSISSDPSSVPSPKEIDQILDALSSSRKPVFIVGNGLRLSNKGKGIDLVLEFCKSNSIPLVSTYLGVDFFPASADNYLGVVGLKAARRANIILHNSDLVVAIGTRLATSVIGFEYEYFAPNAKIFIVDIDPEEHAKNTRSAMTLIHADAFAFSVALSNRKPSHTHSSEWIDTCRLLRQLLPVQEQYSPEGSISIYDTVRIICENYGDNDVLVSDAGSAYYVASIMFQRNRNQRYITSGAQADMGFSLPASIGIASAITSSNSRVHAVTGDGSFQLNLQEIQTLVSYFLPITVYILNNNGYLSIKATQNSFFPGRQCGTGPASGVDFPMIDILCDAYGIAYRKAATIEDLSNIVNESNGVQFPIICEVLCPEDELIIPRSISHKRPDGTFESAPLCTMYPELPQPLKDMLCKLNLIH